jgi:PrtD family type I secretion system ABC transporter
MAKPKRTAPPQGAHTTQGTVQLTVLEQALRTARKGFIAVAVFSFFLNLLMLATPIYMLQVFQRVLGSGHNYTLLYLTAITIFALLILGVLFTVRMWILSRISGWLNAALSGPLISASLQSSLAGNPLGSQPLRDLGHIQGFISGSGITAMFDSPWVPVFVAVIWLMHPWLGILALVSAILLFVLALLNELSTREAHQEAQQEQARANHFADGSLRNAEVVQAMGMMPALLGHFSKLNNRALDQQAVAGGRSATIQGISRFLRLSVQVGILGTGALLVLNSELTPGQMIAASILLGRALAPVEQSIAGWRTFVMARTSYGRLQELLQITPDETTPMELPPPTGHIQVESASFVHPGSDKPVLRNINLSVKPGETLVVIGPSAAGKSTFCRLLVGVWVPTVGSVRLDAAEVSSWSRAAFGRYVGYLPQDVELFNGTVRQNIARMGEAEDSEVVEAASLADVHEMILRLPDGYDTPVGPGGAALSAGQRQRIGLARALFRNPKVLVLDEPSASLDRQGEAALLRALTAFKKMGTTIVVVAHHASMLEGADKILVLQEGNMTDFGPKNEVLSHLQKKERSATQQAQGKVLPIPNPTQGG